MIEDPAVPDRDALLHPETMARVISRRLLDGVPVERCKRSSVKYRVGDSLRVVYRYDGRYVAARTGKRDGIAAPEVGAALYPFPHDRKLAALPALAPGSPVLERLLGQPVTPRLVAYAAEQSATAECRDGHGRVLAYAKVQRDDGERRGCEALAGQDAVRVPRILAAADGVLLLEALHGRRLAGPSFHALGTSLAALHNLKGDSPLNVLFSDDSALRGGFTGVQPTRSASVKGQSPLTRLYPERLERAAHAIALVRPDVTAAAGRLLAHLLDREADAQREEVLLHGDVNLGNALVLGDGRVALLDLEHLCVGPAAADLGQVLANLMVSRTPGGAGAVLRGYGTPPDEAALRWYTAAAILTRVALPAVSRFRPDVLARLGELLVAAAVLVRPRRVAA